MSLRVLHITSSLQMGGAETLLCATVAQLQQRDVEQWVLYIHDGPKRAELTALNIPVIQVRGLLSVYDPWLLVRIYRNIKRFKPDCVHSWLWLANVTARLVGKWTGVSVINALHNNLDQDGPIRERIDRWTVQYAQGIVAVSDGVARSFNERYGGYHQYKLHVIRNGVKAGLVRERAQAQRIERSALNIPDSAFIVGAVGRFVQLKNYPLLLDAIALVPEIYCVLVGGGPELENLQRYTEKLGIQERVRFVVGKSAYGYYHLFDCFVQPSFKEGISLALLEAMSCGVPPIVLNPAAMHDVVEHSKSGLLLMQYQPNALADAIGMLYNNHALQKQIGIDAQLRVENDFIVERMVEEYYALYQGSKWHM